MSSVKYGVSSLCFLSFAIFQFFLAGAAPGEKYSSYDELTTFFTKWRQFQAPKLVDGVPDYTVSAMKQQHQELQQWQKNLQAFDTTGWPVKQQVDWYLLYAEMNGMDFDHRVLRPWERDPAFYVWFFSYPSDVPAREGPHIHGSIELPQYKQPLSTGDAGRIMQQLDKAEAVFAQARQNLTGNARDLWVTGIRSIRDQHADLEQFGGSIENQYPKLATSVRKAMEVSNKFAAWLEQQAPSKDGISGIGKENYTWYLRNVHLLPYSWEDERVLLERELARGHSALRMLEHQNRHLPMLEKAASAEAYAKLQTDAVNEYMDFFEREEFITVEPYMKAAMMEQLFAFNPSKELLGFFYEIDYRDPMPMRAHHFHWIDKAREALKPHESPIRRTPLLYNIFDSRAEGLATGMEELVMHAGMLENRPRAKELVYIMLIMRAARGLAGVYQHGQEITFDEATTLSSKWVPRGLLPADGGTIQGEQQFYLQQPGYGSSYVMGKLDIDMLIAEYARQRDGQFRLKEFMDEFTSKGIIPMSLIHWEITGDKSLLNRALEE